MKIATAQINTKVGDIHGNAALIAKSIVQARKQGADLVVFPELALVGYPPKDLLFRKEFVDENLAVLEKLVKYTDGVAILVGFVDRVKDVLYNAAAFIKDKKLVGVYHKQELPQYDVFDEQRYFSPGKKMQVFKVGGVGVGVTICEDLWTEKTNIPQLVRKGASVIVNLSASPFSVDKFSSRNVLLSRLAKENKVSLVYCNLVGCNDELLFDGNSTIHNAKGKLLLKAKAFDTDLLIHDLKKQEKIVLSENVPSVYDALIMGMKDYAVKNGFEKVVVGVSGGIDSAVTLSLAVRAFGKENVTALLMPSKYTPWKSLFDARKICKRYGVEFNVFFIRKAVASFESLLSKLFKKTKRNVAEENLQARVRGTMLMAVSNKFGWLVLSTGNKSELAVGYCTLYGDMAGGVCVLGDVYKTMVYRLAEHHNAVSDFGKIPDSILKKAPSAELREGQKDTDELPPYDVLDKILFSYVEEGKSVSELLKMGFVKENVEKVVGLVDKSEFKRYQAPFCFRISEKAFGSGRRMPITSGFKSF